MTLTLYVFPASFPARACMILTKVLGLDVKFEIVDLFKLENLKDDYMKINFQHVVPTLVDGDFVLWESRAINTYLVSAYAKDDSLYPKDLKKRAIVDQRLYFDASLFEKLRSCFFPVFFYEAKTVPEDRRNAVKESLKDLDKFLEGQSFAAGNTFTLADISLIPSVTSAEANGFDLTPYKNIKPWIERCKKLIPDYEEANQKGLDDIREAFTSKIGIIKL